MIQIIEKLNWRYAVKKYDTDKKVSAENISSLKEAMRLSSSSYGLQPYRILDIVDKDIRAKLLPFSFNQSQIIDASHLFVIATENVIDEAYVNAYFENLSHIRNTKIEGEILDYKNFMVASMARMTDEAKKHWSKNQAYLALGNLLFAAALLEIDISPMEGFMANKYDEALGLEGKGLSSVVIAAVGFRHPDDHLQYLKKVRKPDAQLFETI